MYVLKSITLVFKVKWDHPRINITMLSNLYLAIFLSQLVGSKHDVAFLSRSSSHIDFNEYLGCQGGGGNMTVLSLKRSTTCAVNVRIRSERKRPLNGDSVRSNRALKAGRPSVFIKLHVQGRCILII